MDRFGGEIAAVVYFYFTINAIRAQDTSPAGRQ